MSETEVGKILYIGKNPDVIEQLSKARNIKLRCKDNGIAAIHWISDNIEEYDKLDAVLCSLGVKGMNAFSLYNHMRLRNLLNRIPFIVIAQSFEFDSRALARYHNVDDYYALPLDIERLETRVEFLKKYKAEYLALDLKKTFEKYKNQPYKTPFLKRTFDILMSGGAILVLSPILLFTALAIRLESKGKVFYSSRRVGANFHEFDFYKFRSMYPDAEKRLKEVEHLNQYQKNTVGDECPRCRHLPEDLYCSAVLKQDDNTEICEYFYFKRKNAKAAFLKIENDPRITKVGKFIRNKSIDELPQLFNILIGDMSIVGNRPLPVSEATAITKSRWSRRFETAAGLTGLWQVELRGKDGEMSEEERFELDNKYAKINSFWGDIILILRTLKIFIQKGSV
ncbi:MAG: sugar transferase [Bacteroidales bacterium]|jgi:lipopolysaccharide/colanic/teichoic acid biosynthesis glycosyltransferase|nr:sugar transferase [Bacteroidales bacterium]